MKKKNGVEISFLLKVFSFFFFISCSSVEKGSKQYVFIFKEALINEKIKDKLEKGEEALYWLNPMQDQGESQIESQKSVKAKDKNFFNKSLLRLEKNLKSQKEKKQYYTYLTYFNDDETRIKFLLLPNFQAREEWFNERKFLDLRKRKQRFLESFINKQDVTIGMNQKEVLESLGIPYHIKVSGQSVYQNEVWYYLDVERFSDTVSSSSSYPMSRIYFERGLVIGWDRI